MIYDSSIIDSGPPGPAIASELSRSRRVPAVEHAVRPFTDGGVIRNPGFDFG